MRKLSEPSSFTLDILRVIAAQMVLVGHTMSMFDLWPQLQQPYLPNMQSFAVVVFLFLSGLLITYSTMHKKDGTFKLYFIDRFARVYSAVLPCLVFILMIDLVQIYIGNYQHADALDIRTFITNLLMLQDYPYFLAISEVTNNAWMYLTSFGSGRPLWTIAVEWWIYMAFGVLVFRNAFTKRWVFWGLLLFSLSTPVFYLMYDNRGSGLGFVWLLGFAAFWVLAKDYLREVGVRASIVAALLFAGIGLVRLKISMFEYDVLSAFSVSVGILFLLNATQQGQRVSPGIRKVVRFMADYSFTLYLTHYTLAELMSNWNTSPYVLWGTTLLLANVVAILIAIPTEMKHKKVANLLKGKTGVRPAQHKIEA